MRSWEKVRQKDREANEKRTERKRERGLMIHLQKGNITTERKQDFRI